MSHPHFDGYRPCACRDCMEIAIGAEGAMCHDCEAAGCEGDGECEAPCAYGGGDDEEEPAPGEPPAADITRRLAQLEAIDPAAAARVAPLLNAIPEAARADAQHAHWSTDEAVEALTELWTAIAIAEAR